ncbi:MAG: hypothetical protein IT303_11055 [Dehalococcoidia bacterium]|nr:hypothetical protein [Dehalococcoidia bacterium]
MPCEHHGCNCQAQMERDGHQYCSAECAEGRQDSGSACRCPHPSCQAAPATA